MMGEIVEHRTAGQITLMRARFPADDVDLRKEHFFKEVLKPAWKGRSVKGFRKGKVPRQMIEAHYGGTKQCYHDVYQDLLKELVFASLRRRLLVCTDLDLKRFGDDVEFAFAAHLLPEAHLPDDFDLSKIELEVPEAMSDESQISLQADSVMERARTRALGFNGKAGPIADGDYAVVSIKAETEGDTWEPGCLDRKTVQIAEDKIHPIALYKSFLGRSEGAAWEQVITLDERFGDLAGTKVEQACKVHTVMTPIEAVLDDKFAKGLGYESVADWREKLTAQIRGVRNQRVYDHLLQQLQSKVSSVADFDPVPEVWEAHYVRTRISELKERFSENQLLDAYGVSTEEELGVKISEEGRASLRKELAVLALGESIGMPVDDISINPQHLNLIASQALHRVRVSGLQGDLHTYVNVNGPNLGDGTQNP